ncbi:hypothetical protein [Actinoplanes sp. NPDC049802]
MSELASESVSSALTNCTERHPAAADNGLAREGRAGMARQAQP